MSFFIKNSYRLYAGGIDFKGKELYCLFSCREF